MKHALAVGEMLDEKYMAFMWQENLLHRLLSGFLSSENGRRDTSLFLLIVPKLVTSAMLRCVQRSMFTA